MSNVVIIHGGPLDDVPQDPHNLQELYWVPWVKKKLERLDMEVQNPMMPNPWEPSYEEWKNEIEKIEITDDTVLVGHSRGCAFLVRWLGETGCSARKLILVAPNFVTQSTKQSVVDFYDFEIEPSIQERVGEIIVFTSDTEDSDGHESLGMLQSKFGRLKVISLDNHGHYITEEMGGDEFPELLEACVDFDKRKALLIPVNSKNQILMQDRAGHKSPPWGFFGGGIDGEETAEQAVIRESKEELNIDIGTSDIAYIGVSPTLWDEHKIMRYLFVYRTEQEKFVDLEGSGAHWLTREEAEERTDTEELFEEIVEMVLGKK